MEEPDTTKEESQIQTFVFLDLESTGLARDSPRITELSMVAVSRTHFLQMKESTPSASPSRITSSPPSPPQATTSSSAVCARQSKRKLIPALPRVLHKYTRLYYPWKVIGSVVEGKSGLNNESLEHLPSFTEDSAQAISLFLDLPKPVALVAHNGNRYDFPLLMAELSRVNCQDKFLDLHCIDTLVATKDIDALIEREDISDITKLAESFNLEDFEEDLSQEAFSPSKRPRTTESDEEGSPLFNTPPSPLESPPSSQDNNHQPLQVSPKPLMTPIKNHSTAQPSTPATPSKPAEPPPLPYTPNRSGSVTPGTPGFHAKATKESSKVRRALTYEKRWKQFPRHRLYNQPEIYRRLFDSEYKAHRAEEDCTALLTICGHYGSKFVEWADTFATSFARVKPMWVKRKSFHTSQEG